MPKSMSVGRFKPIAGLLAAASLALTLSSCASYDTTSPRSAREKAMEGNQGAARPVSDTKSKGAAEEKPVDCSKAKCVALTFDAGPSEHTPRLLDILKKEKVHATFFMLGKNHVVKRPADVRRIDAEGHELANHTWSHGILTDLKPDEIREELSSTQDAVEKITGKKPALMRPPQGRTNDEISQISKDLGLAQVLWSVTAKDYQTTDSELIKKRVLEQTKRDGVILLHDIYDGTVPAVPGIIKELKERGFTIVTVGQLLSPAKPEPGVVYKP